MRGETTGGRTRPWIWALAAVLGVLAWQALTVQANYAGNWTGLFHTGWKTRVPERLAPGTFRHANSLGYDGQYYRFLAHDPFLRHGTLGCFDAPWERSRRILVPLLAWALAAGQQGAIDGAYMLVILASIFAGTCFLGRILVRQGRHAALGLLFLAVPATIVGVDTMTVDVTLAALTACFVWHWGSGHEPGWGLWLTLAAAGLTRETGLLLAAACILASLVQRDYRKAAFWGTAMLPALGWYGYLHFVIPQAGGAPVAIPAWVWPRPRLGIVMRAFDPPRHPTLGAPVERIIRAFDSLSLLAMMAAAVLGTLRLRMAKPAAIGAALGLEVALLLAITNKVFWSFPSGYCRPFAPLFVLLLAGDAVGRGRRAWVAAILLCALVDVRVLAEMGTQVWGVLRWL